VIWTAEFASQKWLMDMTPYIETRQDEFIPSTLSSVDFEDKMWGVPRVSDAGLLYYRSDKVQEVPATWQAVYEQAKSGKGLIYQGAAYEGLTVHFLEMAYGAGGEILSEDGKKSVIDSPENLKALELMVNGIKDGSVPKAVTTYMEEEARRVFEAGRADFQRQWPYAYALGNMKGSKIKGKFEVAPYPEFEGGQKAAILGGHNSVISTYSKNPGGALKLIDYMTSEKRMTKNATKYSKTPVLEASFGDPAVKEALPFIDELKQAVEQAKSRPVSPVYSQISQAIYKNVNQALSGSMEPKEALQKAQSDMDKALATF
jgi:multiple sugar transport system substrate-binding protein